MKKSSNKGFTLIEIIIAVVVLAVVVIPLLNGFVTTARVNQKSRKMLMATNAAQSIMEKYAGMSTKEVAEAINSGTPFTEDPSHIYVYDFSGHVYNGTAYDIRMTLDASAYFDPSGAGGYNDKKYPKITSVDTVQDAIYAESEDVLKNSLDEFVNRNMTRTTDGDRSITKSQFEQRLSRTICLDISKNPSDSSKRIDITYEYTAPSGYVDPGDELYSKSLNIYSDEHLAEADRKNLRNVYVLIRPYYKGLEDKIVINNPDNLEFNLFLIKLITLSGTELRNEEDFYKMELTLNENHVGSVSTASMKLFTNVGKNLEDDSNVLNQLELKYFPRPGLPGAANMIEKDYFLPEYNSERIYNMKVEVFEAGAGFAAASKIVELSNNN